MSHKNRQFNADVSSESIEQSVLYSEFSEENEINTSALKERMLAYISDLKSITNAAAGADDTLTNVERQYVGELNKHRRDVKSLLQEINSNNYDYNKVLTSFIEIVIKDVDNSMIVRSLIPQEKPDSNDSAWCRLKPDEYSKVRKSLCEQNLETVLSIKLKDVLPYYQDVMDQGLVCLLNTANEERYYIIANDSSFAITYDDVLISITSASTMMTCKHNVDIDKLIVDVTKIAGVVLSKIGKV